MELTVPTNSPLGSEHSRRFQVWILAAGIGRSERLSFKPGVEVILSLESAEILAHGLNCGVGDERTNPPCFSLLGVLWLSAGGGQLRHQAPDVWLCDRLHGVSEASFSSGVLKLCSSSRHRPGQPLQFVVQEGLNLPFGLDVTIEDHEAVAASSSVW